jgi:hypothetical protein
MAVILSYTFTVYDIILLILLCVGSQRNCTYITLGSLICFNE